MLEEPELAFFRRLDKLDRSPMQKLEAGQHLFAVYGDKFVSKTRYTVLAVNMTPQSEDSEAIRKMDAALRTKQMELAALEKEYLAARQAWTQVQHRLSGEQEELEDLLEARSGSYGQLFGHTPPTPTSTRKKPKAGCAQQ